jgi:hypothetical protein
MIAMPFDAPAGVQVRVAVSFDNAVPESRLRLETTVENRHIRAIVPYHFRMGDLGESTPVVTFTNIASWRDHAKFKLMPRLL